MKMRMVGSDLWQSMWVLQLVMVACLLPSSEADISYQVYKSTYILFLSLHPNDK